MLTDWAIVRRLAAELDSAVRGKRIEAAGRLAGGLFGLQIAGAIVAIDAFGPTPLVVLQGSGSPTPEAGWTRAIAGALVGMRFEAVRARHGDRVLGFDCSARSRFGVRAAYRLIAELVPRFGNIVLVKENTVVAAAKEFPPSVPGRRATVIGKPYEPPPVGRPRPPSEPLEKAFDRLTLTDGADERDVAARALRADVPLVPPLIAASIVSRNALGAAGFTPRVLAERCLESARTFVADAGSGAYDSGDVFAYRDGTLVQCHVVALTQYAALHESREPALLPLLRESVGSETDARMRAAFEARRASMRTRLEKRRAEFAATRSILERESDDASERDALRIAGGLLYAHLDEVAPGADRFTPSSNPELTIPLDPALDAKGNAAAVFKRYRRATNKREHVQGRLTRLTRDEEIAADIAWELERAEPETLEDVAESIGRLERPKGANVRERSVRTKPLDVRLSGDARVLVGRSPRSNADLTFKIARPDDLWFHARATPGAHVVLRFDSPRAPTEDELRRAAALAAYHSKARASQNVGVDYTQRKYVRRQHNAPPGLVWYSNARTILVTPAVDGKP